MRYSVVIPVFDEEESVVAVLEELRTAALAPQPLEVIIVDDGSRDATAARLATLPAGEPPLILLRHRQRCGKSAAIRTGSRAARGDWILTMDGDGQNDPADVPRLLVGADAQGIATLIAGVRVVRDDRPLRRVASRVANAVCEAALGDGCPDGACGLKLFPKQALLEMPFFEGMHRFLPTLFRMHGYAVRTVAVRGRTRFAGRSKYGAVVSRGLTTFADLLGVIWLRRRTRLPETGADPGTAQTRSANE